MPQQHDERSASDQSATRPRVSTAEEKRFVLPRKVGDRIVAFVLSCTLTGFFALQLIRLQKEAPIGWLRKAINGLAVEALFIFSILSVLALIWAVFTPRWLESFLNRIVRKVLTTIAVVLGVTALTILYYAL